jgi:hypothetical protein
VDEGRHLFVCIWHLGQELIYEFAASTNNYMLLVRDEQAPGAPT